MSRSASHASVLAAYAVLDFLAVLFGYAISGERTLEEFYQRLQPFAVPFMALFERERFPSRSALSRFLAALTEAPVEALRTLLTSRSAAVLRKWQGWGKLDSILRTERNRFHGYDHPVQMASLPS